MKRQLEVSVGFSYVFFRSWSVPCVHYLFFGSLILSGIQHTGELPSLDGGNIGVKNSGVRRQKPSAQLLGALAPEVRPGG